MWELTVLGSLILAGYALWRQFFSNRIIVDPGIRERVVMRDLRGEMIVLGPGTHYLAPWWKLFKTVECNREPVEVESDSVKTHDNVMVEIAYRYDMIAGRPFDKNGILKVKDVDDTTLIDDKEIKSAVTAIDYDQREMQIKQRVRSVMEKVFAGLTDKELFLIGVEEGTVKVFIPKSSEPPWILNAHDVENPKELLFKNQEKAIMRADELYDRLGKLIELKVNYDLRFLGINIVSFQITKVLYLDKVMQKALETKQQRERLEEATEKMDLSPAQKFALNTDQFGQVTQAEAIKKASENVSDAIAKAIENWLKGGKP